VSLRRDLFLVTVSLRRNFIKFASLQWVWGGIGFLLQWVWGGILLILPVYSEFEEGLVSRYSEFEEVFYFLFTVSLRRDLFLVNSEFEKGFISCLQWVWGGLLLILPVYSEFEEGFISCLQWVSGMYLFLVTVYLRMEIINFASLQWVWGGICFLSQWVWGGILLILPVYSEFEEGFISCFQWVWGGAEAAQVATGWHPDEVSPSTEHQWGPGTHGGTLPTAPQTTTAVWFQNTFRPDIF